MGTIAERERGVMSDGHFLLFQSLPSSALFFIIGSLKQRRFGATHIYRKWTFCTLELQFSTNFWANRLFKSKGTQLCRVESVKAHKIEKGLLPVDVPRSKTDLELLKLPNILTQQALCSWGHVIKSFLKKIYIMGHNLNNAGDGKSISNIPKWSSLGPWAYRVLFIQQFELSEN